MCKCSSVVIGAPVHGYRLVYHAFFFFYNPVSNPLFLLNAAVNELCIFFSFCNATRIQTPSFCILIA